ncbi:zinc metalloproteinase-disintegrin-like NaMP [Eurytemora carolleeae]|uniref:zinc metalloproteinase-disintegrin-like NaMP n=1 Tax=Eurytemora carolleeae TaxID=1294199 RepID=UPI000C76EEDC|nr:zinc metalloproteinase-disintegrin-like NaMP [Eurytemora carolleeae]|eukprot:XP_023329257.1 zinc metalloproteinase-disintegrin-like NaMP [Eurytemora affinis]
MSSFLNQTTPDEFSNCSIRAIQEKLTEVLNSERNCIQEPRNTEVEIAVCGNGILEPGEQCDCGYDEISCNDPCCYPASISQADRDYNTTGALPCSTNQRKRCVNPPGLVYGIYIPLVFILIASILVIVLLKNDWSRDKTLFRHITHGNIKIVARKRQGVNSLQSSEQEAGLSS